MKRTRLLILALATLGTLFGVWLYSIHATVRQPQLDAHIAVVKAGVERGWHYCAAPVKRGTKGGCQRHVSNGDGTDNAVEARCWEHRGSK